MDWANRPSSNHGSKLLFPVIKANTIQCRKRVGRSAIPARSCPGPVRYHWGSIAELEVPPDETPELMTLQCVTNITSYIHWSKQCNLVIFPKKRIFFGNFLHQNWTLLRGVLDVTKRHFLSKNAFSWKPKKLTKKALWVWFRIPQTSPDVRARWVAKTVARFYHSKFETNPPWLIRYSPFRGRWDSEW